jgi:rhamnosyltransferase subunit B
MSKHIVMTVFGSLGDLHPMMALAMGLQARGHRVTIAASRLYQEKIVQEGIGYAPLGPEVLDAQDSRIFDELFDLKRGPEILIRKYLLPFVRDTALDLRPLLEKADFLINSPTVYAGPVLAEALKIPWTSVALQPFIYFSAYDPPVLPQLPLTEFGHRLGPGFWKVFWYLLKRSCDNWPQTVYQLQKELGVPNRGNPLFEGQYSPYLNLALYSPHVAPMQPDWPPHTQVTGFLFYDRMKPKEEQLPPAMQEFLNAGEPPVVFTLGSSVVKTTTSFYETSMQAVQALGCRAVFLAGENQPSIAPNERMFWWDAVAYSALFPYAAAVVHQGGMGTTAQVLRAGKPMLVVPHGFDQPDNAARMKKLCLSRTVYPDQYCQKRVTRELKMLLGDSSYQKSAAEMGQLIRSEEGLKIACDSIEAVL